ncbi:MAG: T9SS type A sorting domain-containing protein [Ignavibacteriales bacterium]|nr:T9SS type A sorting domain-containing protein [Ignavibacteriales bacterium]
MHLRRSSQNKISNTLIAGWPTGVRLDGQYTIEAAINNDMWLDNSVISGWNTVDLDTVSAANQSFDIHSWFSNADGRTYANNSDLQLNDPFNLTNPNFLPEVGSPLLSGAATPPNDGFFDVTATFVGAFGPTDWTFEWSNFNPGSYVTAVEESGSGLVSDFRLEQNFPNPFNPSTTIRFAIPNSGNVKLSVTNILGQEVAVLLNEFKNAGSYDINFDASQIASGLYIYKIEADGIIISKKMTLLK